MAKYQPLWQQGGSYPAQLDRQLLSALWPGGGLLGGAVTAVANGMTVSVAPGSAAVPLQPGQGSALCHWDAAELVGPLDPPPPSGQSRVDLIVCQVRDPDIDGGASNDFQLVAISGTPALTATQRPGAEDRDTEQAEPRATPPAVPQNALALYAVTVPGGAANLNEATITVWTRNPLAVQPGLLGNPSGRMISALGATGPLPAGSWVAVNLQGDNNVMRGGMRRSGNNLVVPVTGIYQVNWACIFSANGGGNAPATFFNVCPCVNGGRVRESSASWPLSIPTVQGSDLILMNAGDALGMQAQVGANCIVADVQPPGTFLSASLASI